MVLGKTIYQQRCMLCHKLGSIGLFDYGPDLTGYERDNKEYFISNILYPSTPIREWYTLLSLEMHDGSSNTGIHVSEDAQRITLKIGPGAEQTFLKKNIKNTNVLTNSPMPPGMLGGLTPKDIASLLEYIEQAL